MKDIIKRLRREDGQAMVEYSIILALIAIAALTIIGTLGGQVNDVFTQISTQLEGVL